MLAIQIEMHSSPCKALFTCPGVPKTVTKYQTKTNQFHRFMKLPLDNPTFSVLMLRLCDLNYSLQVARVLFENNQFEVDPFGLTGQERTHVE